MTILSGEPDKAALQWRRLRKLNLVGAKLEYLTRVSPIDRAIARILLPLLPPTVTPNAITVFRFVTIPFIAYFLLTGATVWGVSLFVLAALSDALDGALARTTHQITKWGIVADPLADKLLIAATGAIVITRYLGWRLTAAIVGIEMLLLASAYFRYRGRYTPAKTVGKAKMVLQCVGVGFVLLYALTPLPLLLTVGQATLYGAVVFGLLSLFVYRSI